MTNTVESQPGRDVVAVVRHLALVTDVKPAAIKNLRHFAIKRIGVGKGSAIYAKHIIVRPVVDHFTGDSIYILTKQPPFIVCR